MPRHLIVVHGEQANYCLDVRFLWPAMQTTSTNCSHILQFREIPINVADTETLKNLDAVVIQRPVAQQWKNIIAYYTNLRKSYDFNIVVEFDDALWNLYESCDDVMKYIKGGVNYCTVTNKVLKKEIEKRYGIKTIVVPNGVADNLIHPSKGNDKVILYGGAGGHSQDWNDEWKKAINILIEQGWEFHCFHEPIDGINDCKIHPFVDAINFGAELAKIPASVYVAPLSKDYQVNTYKSNLKYLESGALEIPFVGTKLPGEGPYNYIPDNQVVSHDAKASDIIKTIILAYDNRDAIVKSQNEYLERKHLRHTDSRFTEMFLNSYLNGDQQQGW